MRTTTAMTLGQAAAATGVNKATILRAIKSGRLSAGKDTAGRWAIEPSELFRIYPAPLRQPGEQSSDATLDNPSHNATRNASYNTPRNAPETDGETRAEAALRAHLAEVRESRDALRRELEREQEGRRRELEAAQEERDATLRLLTDQRERAAKPKEPPRSLWRRLLGR